MTRIGTMKRGVDLIIENDEKVIVTGAGSGIGKEMVRLFLEDGASVLAVSLMDTELLDLKNTHTSHGDRLATLEVDLSGSCL